MRAVADNDILLKGACYGLLSALISTVSGEGPVGILGASRFVIPKRITRHGLQGSPAVAETHFTDFVAKNAVVEPSADEQQMAALFEEAAQRLSLNLDAGESQLVAILVSRSLRCFLTGDKRAIASIDGLLDSDSRLGVAVGKVRCLEQLVTAALATLDMDQMRQSICAEPSVDKTLTICFGCRSKRGELSTILAALASYIADLRTKASRVLAAS